VSDRGREKETLEKNGLQGGKVTSSLMQKKTNQGRKGKKDLKHVAGAAQGWENNKKKSKEGVSWTEKDLKKEGAGHPM